MTIRSIALAVVCALQGSILQAQSGLAERANGQDPLNPCGLGSTAFANWIALGETIAFTNALSGGGAMEGAVRDTSGRLVYQGAAVGNRWSWTPERAGFYKVRFTAVQQGERNPVVLVLRAQQNEKTNRGDVLKTMTIGEFPRDEFAIAVSPAPPRESKDAPPKFGFNVRAHPNLRNADALENERALPRLLGMNAILRIHYYRWDEIERTEGKYDWTVPDATLRYWLDHGYAYDRLLINIFGTPEWLSTVPTNRASGWYDRAALYAPRDMKPVQRFFRAFCERYRGIRHVEVWNEPHLPGYSVFWKNGTPEQFVDLLKHAYLGVKEASPGINVVMGGIGPRYLPFYERIVPLGAVNWYDMMDTHNGYDMRPFRNVERRAGAASKPYWEGEWHAALYNCKDPDPPNEEECAFRMLSNFANLLHTVKTHIIGFGPFCGKHTPETAKAYARFGGIHQVCGLFRDLPMKEPRFIAFALRTATDLFAGDIRALGAWRFGEDGRYVAVAQASDRGSVAFVWTPQSSTKRGVVPPEFVTAAKGGRLLDWEGHETDFSNFEPRRMYYIVNPDLDVLKTGVPADSFGHKVSTSDLDQRARAGYGPCARPTPMGTAGAKFKAELDDSGIRLVVKTPKGEIPDSLGFVVDAEGRGLFEDVIEFRVSPDGSVVKLRTPQLKGDIPSDYSLANVKLTRSNAVVKDGVWSVNIWRGDLFPYAYSQAGSLPFSVALKTNCGRHAWGGGWNRIVEPARFGLLVPSGGGRVVATTASVDVKNPFENAAVRRTPDGALHIAATSAEGSSGIVLPIDYEPGSRISYRGQIRGKAPKVNFACWCSLAKGVPPERCDAGRICALSDGWVPFSGAIDMPKQSKSGVLKIFTWHDGDARWEIRDLKIVNE